MLLTPNLRDATLKIGDFATSLKEGNDGEEEEDETDGDPEEEQKKAQLQDMRGKKRGPIKFRSGADGDDGGSDCENGIEMLERNPSTPPSSWSSANLMDSTKNGPSATLGDGVDSELAGPASAADHQHVRDAFNNFVHNVALHHDISAKIRSQRFALIDFLERAEEVGQSGATRQHEQIHPSSSSLVHTRTLASARVRARAHRCAKRTRHRVYSAR